MADGPLPWDTIAASADEHQLIRTIVALSENSGANVSMTLTREGSDRTVSISTGVYAPEPEDSLS